MLWSSRRPTVGSQLRALRELYRKAVGENRPEARARRLLYAWLSPEQRKQYDRLGYFEVVGCDSGRRYRIHQGACANIYEVDDKGTAGSGWCFVPFGGLAPGDVMLAQKIALETAETAALAVANRLVPDHRYRHPFATPY